MRLETNIYWTTLDLSSIIQSPKFKPNNEHYIEDWIVHSYEEAKIPLLSENDLENQVPQSLDPEDENTASQVLPKNDIENQTNYSEETKNENTALQLLSDRQIYEKLSRIKNTFCNPYSLAHLIDDGPRRSDIVACQVVTASFGMLTTIIGGISSVAIAIDPTDFYTTRAGQIGLAAFTGVGIVSLMGVMASCFSSKCKAYTLRCINKPISFSTFVNPEELNQLLENLNLNPINAEKILSTRDVVDHVIPTINKAISLTGTGQQLKMGEMVLSALSREGLFPSPLKSIVLDYLISDKKIVEQLTAKEKITSMAMSRK